MDDQPRPDIEEHESGYIVSLPTSNGWIRMNAEGLEQPRRHVLELELTTWVEQPGQKLDPFSGHLNALSLSSRESYRRHLDEQFPNGKGYWTGYLNRACTMIRNAWTEKDWSIDLRHVEADLETRYLLRPFILEGLPTIIFGAGGSGKTYLALAMAKAMVEDGEFLGRACPMGPVLFIDYEARKEETKKRLMKLGVAPEHLKDVIYWPGRGRPLTEMVRPVGRLISQRGVRLIVVDSAALACGGDPKEEHVATAYFNALAALDVASLTIAHVTKADSKDEERRPYGSIFWENSARVTWKMKAAEDDENPRHLGLFNMKANEDQRERPIGVKMSFELTGVTIERETLTEELMEAAGLKSRIRALLLRRGKLSVTEIAEHLSAKPASVKATLHRIPDAMHEGDTGGRGKEGLWMIVAKGEVSA